jgi:hypothetical protein
VSALLPRTSLPLPDTPTPLRTVNLIIRPQTADMRAMFLPHLPTRSPTTTATPLQLSLGALITTDAGLSLRAGWPKQVSSQIPIPLLLLLPLFRQRSVGTRGGQMPRQPAVSDLHLLSLDKKTGLRASLLFLLSSPQDWLKPSGPFLHAHRKWIRSSMAAACCL